MPSLRFTDLARDQLNGLESDPKKLKKVRKCLGVLERNPKHPSLHSHKYCALKGDNSEDVWESYIENNTPSAWRVFWHYGPTEGVSTVFAITPHP